MNRSFRGEAWHGPCLQDPLRAVSFDRDAATLHYVTRDRQEHTSPVETVDRGSSERLNRDQRVLFHLP